MALPLFFHLEESHPLYQSESISFVTTICHVPIYLPPSPSWIIGVGNLNRFTSFPISMFSLHGPLFTIIGFIIFFFLFIYSSIISDAFDRGSIPMDIATLAKYLSGLLLT